jgi:hypothetical protein
MTHDGRDADPEGWARWFENLARERAERRAAWVAAGKPPPTTITLDQIRDQVAADQQGLRAEGIPGLDDEDVDHVAEQVWHEVEELAAEYSDAEICRKADRGERAADALFYSWPAERQEAAAAEVDRLWARQWKAGG